MSSKKLLRPRHRNTHHSVSLADLSPLLARIYQQRGITSLQQTSRELKDLLPFSDLLNIQTAVELLATTLIQQQKILIIGDFDADGATSTALAISALQSFGAQNVDFLVPNRFDFGYGLTPEIVTLALEKKPHLIITVDNGISSHAGVILAKTHGIHVLITDHHLPGAELPPADVIINPNQPGDFFASKNLAGVGVIFYVMLALRHHLRQQDWFAQQKIPEPNMASLLDLVALGTVADVVPLDHNNRILVHQGLRRMQAGQIRPGIKALLQVAQRSAETLTAADLGYAIAPRLNAAGRLEDMSQGVACLLAPTLLDGLRYATQLDDLNRQRRDIETTMLEQAQRILAKIYLTELPAGICLFEEDWHQGVIGILAGRIKQQYHRPTIIFAQGMEGELKGSARSIPALHMRDLLAWIDAQHPGLMKKFGGHAMAAGVTLAAENLADFRQIYQTAVANRLSADQLQQVLLTDGELSPMELTLENALLLREGGPWGQEFPEPLFEGKFRIHEKNLCADRHLRLLVQPPMSEKFFEAMLFNCTTLEEHTVHMAYRLEVDYFQRIPKLKLIVEAIA